MASGSVTIPTWLQAQLLFQHGFRLSYYSNMASGSVTIWCWTWAHESGQVNDTIVEDESYCLVCVITLKCLVAGFLQKILELTTLALRRWLRG